MRNEIPLHIRESLLHIPDGTLKIERHLAGSCEVNLFTQEFLGQTDGRGKISVYQVFPGVQLSLNDYQGEQIAFQHASQRHILEISHCRLGRIGWNLTNHTSVYLGAGDLSLHSMDCCADSEMFFPLGYSEGITISVNLQELSSHFPPILEEAGVELDNLYQKFCQPKRSIAIPAGPKTDGIFQPMYQPKEALRLPYFKLKIQELILYLSEFNPKKPGIAPYCSQQTALIRKIHDQITGHLEQRYTIEELSRQYLINTTSLKEVFKGVYGLPIASYMKEYRIRRGMELLQNTDESIAQIAAQVGYETQGKFTKAFRDLTRTTPTNYRREIRKKNQEENNHGQ